MNQNQRTQYEPRDVVVGTVYGGCKSGVFLRLENGEEAFAKFGILKNGTKVLCSILKKADARKKFLTLASVDSVISSEELVA